MKKLSQRYQAGSQEHLQTDVGLRAGLFEVFEACGVDKQVEGGNREQSPGGQGPVVVGSIGWRHYDSKLRVGQGVVVLTGMLAKSGVRVE